MLTTMSIGNFKEAVKATKIDILKNPNTEKFFAAGDNGKNYKVEQSIDFKAPIVVLVEDGMLDEACFINQRAGAEIAISL